MIGQRTICDLGFDQYGRSLVIIERQGRIILTGTHRSDRALDLWLEITPYLADELVVTFRTEAGRERA